MSPDAKNWFSGDELALLGERLVAGLPKTMSGSKRRAKKEGWESREVKGSGGPGGILTEYQPPTDVLALIQSFLDDNPEFFKKKRGKPFTSRPIKFSEHVAKQPVVKFENDQDRLMEMARFTAGDEPVCSPAIDAATLNACHKACSTVYGEDFDTQIVTLQIKYAVDLYNLQVRMSAQNGGIEQMKRLEIAGMVDLLKIFIRLGWALKFPPPPMQVGCYF